MRAISGAETEANDKEPEPTPPAIEASTRPTSGDDHDANLGLPTTATATSSVVPDSVSRDDGSEPRILSDDPVLQSTGPGAAAGDSNAADSSTDVIVEATSSAIAMTTTFASIAGANVPCTPRSDRKRKPRNVCHTTIITSSPYKETLENSERQKRRPSSQSTGQKSHKECTLTQPN